MSQLSARAAYGAELRRQIDEKEREKKAKRGTVQQQQNQSAQNSEQGIYSRHRYEFERARIAGGGIGVDAVQRLLAGSAILPPLNVDNSHVDNIWNRSALQQDQRRQQLQPEFRAKNEITAPGKMLGCGQSLNSNQSINDLQQYKAFCVDDL